MKQLLLSIASLCLLWILYGCQNPEHEHKMEVNYLNTPQALEQGLPFSEVVQAGNTLYLAGKVGRKPGEMQVVAGGIQAETRQAMDNIKATLERYGASMDDVVKCTCFLADMSEWASMNEVYKTYFTKHYPARSAVGVNGLALNARVEIECIAVKEE